MPADITFCEDCEHLHPDSRNGPAYRAMCAKFPRYYGHGFVSRKLWDRDPPFFLCSQINNGHCPLFEPKRQPAEEPDGPTLP